MGNMELKCCGRSEQGKKKNNKCHLKRGRTESARRAISSKILTKNKEKIKHATKKRGDPGSPKRKKKRERTGWEKQHEDPAQKGGTGEQGAK